MAEDKIIASSDDLPLVIMSDAADGSMDAFINVEIAVIINAYPGRVYFIAIKIDVVTINIEVAAMAMADGRPKIISARVNFSDAKIAAINNSKINSKLMLAVKTIIRLPVGIKF